MFTNFKALYTFMLAFFSAESLVEDGKINLSDEQIQKLQDALGEKTKVSDVVDAMNKELADAAAKDEEATDQQLVDLKKKAIEMLQAHGLAQEDAEDAVQEGFIKVFDNISKFKSNGSFEGWIRRIMVNTCISYLRKKNPIQLTDEDFVFNDQATKSLESTEIEDIQKMIDGLPIGYKMVFNLYAIEGYKHAEIAEELGITVSTSKSQLFKARKWLQTQYLKLNETVHGDK